MQRGNEFPFILPFFLSCSTIEFFQVQSTKSSKYFSHAHSTQTLEEHETTWRLVLRHVSHVFQKVKCPLLGHWWVLHKSSPPHSAVLVLRGEKLFLLGVAEEKQKPVRWKITMASSDLCTSFVGNLKVFEDFNSIQANENFWNFFLSGGDSWHFFVTSARLSLQSSLSLCLKFYLF